MNSIPKILAVDHYIPNLVKSTKIDYRVGRLATELSHNPNNHLLRAQANIKDTICVPGYTKTVRPPVSFTELLKTKLMQSYRLTDSRFNYELDHLIPLELGGNPSDVRNLWPEPGYGQYNFHVKDRFENYLHDQVCSDTMGLFEAQKEIATDWKTYWIRAGQP